jgi:hypothetical protein
MTLRAILLPALLLTLSACASDPSEVTSGSAVADTTITADAEMAPPFTLTDSNGQEHGLTDFAGKTVVLEWLNYDCPFVGKHYGSGNMQRLQETYTGQGVVWLSVVSSAPGEQGHFEPDAMNARTEQEGGRQTAVLLDPEGTVGRLYGAQTTPQMVVITPDGRVVYNGAIDDRPSTDQADMEGARSYITEALDAVLAGGVPEVSRTEPYGCSVKYAASA